MWIICENPLFLLPRKGIVSFKYQASSHKQNLVSCFIDLESSPKVR